MPIRKNRLILRRVHERAASVKGSHQSTRPGRFLIRWWPSMTVIMLYGATWTYLNHPMSTLSSKPPDILSTLNRQDETTNQKMVAFQQSFRLHSREMLQEAADVPDTRLPILRGRPLSEESSSKVGAVYKYLKYTPANEILPNTTAWALEEPLLTPTRNHETVLLEYGKDRNHQVLVNILGRYSRVVQWRDLQNDTQWQRVITGKDPAGKPLNNLNHVASVVVDRIDETHGWTSNAMTAKKEVWIPCGFHNDRVGREQSSDYVRILDLETMEIRVGPKLPFAGGACTAAAILLEGSDRPPYICSFGGTHGNHDTGFFLPYASCFDRIGQKWVHPFGKLPYGFDHGSLALIPPGICHPNDPSRILVFNYRRKSYSTQESATILAFDLPSQPWSREELALLSAETPGSWYEYAVIPYTGIQDELNANRDAAGLVLANGGRFLVNFGGVHYEYDDYETKTGFRRRDYSIIRSFDVCKKKWQKLGDLGVETYAIQSVASERWNLAFTCGGEARDQEKGDLKRSHRNSQWCIANRLPGMRLENQKMRFTKDFPTDFIAGAKVRTDTYDTMNYQVNS